MCCDDNRKTDIKEMLETRPLKVHIGKIVLFQIRLMEQDKRRKFMQIRSILIAKRPPDINPLKVGEKMQNGTKKQKK